MKELPMGWQKVEVAPLKSDKGTPIEEWEETKNPVRPRTELLRWQRGTRYIRICSECNEETDEDTFALHIGKTGDDKDEIESHSKAKIKLIKRARLLMRQGGY